MTLVPEEEIVRRAVIGENIGRIRESKGVTRTELAQACCKVMPSRLFMAITISDFERGVREIPVDIVADALNVSMGELLKGVAK